MFILLGEILLRSKPAQCAHGDSNSPKGPVRPWRAAGCFGGALTTPPIVSGGDGGPGGVHYQGGVSLQAAEQLGGGPRGQVHPDV